MNVVERVRQDREDLARVLKNHAGIRRIVEDLYPDTAHFIFELLQNAEDTRASEASFVLSEDALVFEHNGRPFDEGDIRGITDIGEGTKAEDDDMIGRFGSDSRRYSLTRRRRESGLRPTPSRFPRWCSLRSCREIQRSGAERGSSSRSIPERNHANWHSRKWVTGSRRFPRIRAVPLPHRRDPMADRGWTGRSAAPGSAF